MSDKNFAEYITFLRENISNLVDYKRSIGCLEPQLSKMEKEELLVNKNYIID